MCTRRWAEVGLSLLTRSRQSRKACPSNSHGSQCATRANTVCATSHQHDPTDKGLHSMTTWTSLVPILAIVLLVVSIATGVGPVLAVVCAIGLIGAVFAAVHHAEVVAHRVGEPFGTLIFAL